MNIYVGNLDYKVKESDLKELFKPYGEVKSSIIISDKRSGKSKGFGFIIMDNDEEANTAIQELNGTTLQDRELKIEEAKPRNDQ